MNRSGEQIRELLLEGKRPVEVCEILGVSRSTVSYHSTALGITPETKSRLEKMKIPWHKVKEFYENGHSSEECRTKWGISRKVWINGVRLADISLRDEEFKKRKSGESRKLKTSRPSGPEEMKNVIYFDDEIIVRGPYVAKTRKGKPITQRRVVTIDYRDGSGKHTTTSYARWLYQQYYQVVLGPDEHVDHIDDDAMHDEISNYQILTPAKNAAKSNLGKPSPFKGTEKGWTHGTIYGWMHKKCKCDICEAAKRKWYDERNEKRRNQSSGKTKYGRPSDHGEKLHYTRGCRCDLCRAANAANARELRKQKKS